MTYFLPVIGAILLMGAAGYAAARKKWIHAIAAIIVSIILALIHFGLLTLSFATSNAQLQAAQANIRSLTQETEALRISENEQK